MAPVRAGHSGNTGIKASLKWEVPAEPATALALKLHTGAAAQGHDRPRHDRWPPSGRTATASVTHIV